MATMKENITNALSWFYDKLKKNDLDPMQKEIDELNSDLTQMPQYEVGVVNAVSLPANSYADYAITFKTAFKSTPRIFANITGGLHLNYGNVTLICADATASGFNLRFINNSSTSFTVYANWIAIL